MPTSIDYLNFDILITRSGDHYRAFVVDAPGGDADAIFALPFAVDEMVGLVQSSKTRRALATIPSRKRKGLPPTLKELGGQLFDALFRDAVRSVLIASQHEAETAKKSLRIRLRFSDDTAELATLPWEILFDSEQKHFLVLLESQPILRYLSLPRSKPALVVQPPLRILAVLATPREHIALDVEGEWQAISTALDVLVRDNKVILERLDSPTRRSLQKRLMGDPVHILHFVGHGAFDFGPNQGLLVFEDDDGNADLVPAESMGLLLQNHSSLRLVYLNACEGATADRSNVFAGVAQTLVRHGVPAALAMQDEITDEAAIELARTFYTALATGRPVDAALTQARVALATANNDEWVLPVLFSRSPDNRLFEMVDVLPTPACPYPGMRPFAEAQADLFFGRDKEIDQAINRLTHYPFLAVVGPSGSGKSSLVFAGVVPALRNSSQLGSRPWEVLTMRPSDSRSPDGSARPREALARLLGSSCDELDQCTFAQKTLVVVDQFEELFTLADAAEAAQFIATLTALIAAPNLYILLTVRADFYSEMMAMGPLWDAVKANRLELTPLNDDALWAAIIEPAAKVGVVVDDALAVSLINDAAGESGALPLVQMTLVLLWDKVEKRELKLHAYRQLGDAARNGLQIAIDLWADNVYKNQLAAGMRPLARRIFLRLIQFGQGRADTRRQQTIEELKADNDDPQLFTETLDILAKNRLLTLSGTSSDEADLATRQVDISHETLISGWGMLRAWIQELRDAETVRRRLDDKAGEWVRLGRGEGGLLDEYELFEAEDWLNKAASNGLGCSPDLILLARASRRLIDDRLQAKEALRRRELEQARQLAHEARTREQAQATAAKHMLWLVVSLAVLLVVALGAGSWIRMQSSQLADRNEALVQLTENAQFEQRRARAGELAALAKLTMDRDLPDMSLALGLAVEAVTTTLEVDGYVLSSASAALTEAAVTAPPWIRTIHTRDQSGEQAAVPPVFDRSAGPAAELSPDARFVLGVTGVDNNAYVWDAETGSLGNTLVGHTDIVYGATYDSTGNRIVTASADGTARIWDARGSTEVAVLSTPDSEVTSAIFSPDGSEIVTTHDDGLARIWDVASGTVIGALAGHTYAALSAAFSPAGDRIATTGVDRSVRIWDARTGEELKKLAGHEGIVRTAQFSPDGERLVTASEDGTARVWDIDQGRVMLLLQEHQSPVYSAEYSPDGRYILTASEDTTARLWDANNGMQVQIYSGHTERVPTARFSSDGSEVVTASPDGTIKLWHSPYHPDLQVLQGHVGSVLSVDYNPGDDRLVTAGGEDRTARIWDVVKGTEIRKLPGHTQGLSVAVYSPDGQRIATAGWDNTIRIWDAGNGAERKELQGHSSLVRSVSFDPTGEQIVSASSDGTVRLWDVATGEQQIIWDDPSTPMFSAVFSPSGNQIAFGGYDGKIHIWDAETHVETAVLIGHGGVVRSIAYHPGGKRLVTSGSDGSAKIWDVESGSELSALADHTDVVYSAAYSPDGNTIITASRDGTARVWDAVSGDELMAFPAHRQPVFDAAFSHDGRQIASAGDDGTIRLWPAGIDTFLAIAESLIQTETSQAQTSG